MKIRCASLLLGTAVFLSALSGGAAGQAGETVKGDSGEENGGRTVGDITYRYSVRDSGMRDFEEISIEDVLKSGTAVDFILKAENDDWVRPIYSEEWEDPAYKEQFPDCSLRVDAALHRLFQMPAGASASYPFYVDLGLEGEELGDIFGAQSVRDYIGLLLIGADVRDVKLLDGQLVIAAEPMRSGYRVLLVSKADLPRDRALIQLATPDGYETDYLPINFE